MDKDRIIAYTLGIPDMDLIYEYCLEMGKKEEDISKFMTVLMFYPYQCNQCFYYALEYYQRKFNICIITDKENRIISAY